MMVIISGTLLILLLPLEAIQASNGICLQSNSQDIVALEGRSVRLECLYCSGSLHTLLWVINNVNYPILNTLPERHRFNEGQYHILIVDDIGSAMNDSTYQCASGGMISGTIHLYVIPDTLPASKTSLTPDVQIFAASSVTPTNCLCPAAVTRNTNGIDLCSSSVSVFSKPNEKDKKLIASHHDLSVTLSSVLSFLLGCGISAFFFLTVHVITRKYQSRTKKSDIITKRNEAYELTVIKPRVTSNNN